MKKLISVLSLVLIITAAKAQQTTEINQTPATNTVSPATGNDKQCTGVSKDCPIPCTAESKKKCKEKSKASAANSEDSKVSSNSSTENMSAEHVGTGSTTISTTSSDKQCKGKEGKSCCHGASKASAINSTPQVQPASAVPQDESPK